MEPRAVPSHPIRAHRRSWFHHALGATRASFPPRREDRRQTPRGGRGGLGDLEDEDRRHVAVLLAAGPAPPSTMVYSQWTGPMPMASASLPFQSTKRGLPLQKIQHLGAAGRGRPPAEKAGSPLHPQRPPDKQRRGPRARQ